MANIAYLMVMPGESIMFIYYCNGTVMVVPYPRNTYANKSAVEGGRSYSTRDHMYNLMKTETFRDF